MVNWYALVKLNTIQAVVKIANQKIPSRSCLLYECFIYYFMIIEYFIDEEKGKKRMIYIKMQ